MKATPWLAALAALLLLTPMSAPAQDRQAPQTDDERASYVVGLSIGRNFQKQGLDSRMDVEWLMTGIRDQLEERERLMSAQEVQAALQKVQQEMMQARAQAQQQAASKNMQASQAYLDEHAQQDGVQTTESGLQYRVIEEGSGESPSDTDTVRTHYEGKLVDGTVFDSSYERGQPATFPVRGVIPGWREALQRMKVGGKWELVVPPDLAYGENAPPSIGPNQALVFEVELLGIQEKQASGQQSQQQ